MKFTVSHSNPFLFVAFKGANRGESATGVATTHTRPQLVQSTTLGPLPSTKQAATGGRCSCLVSSLQACHIPMSSQDEQTFLER